jgi:hypothetical protein
VTGSRHSVAETPPTTRTEPGLVARPVRRVGGSLGWTTPLLLFPCDRADGRSNRGARGKPRPPARLIERNQEPRGARHGSRFVFVLYPRARSGVFPVFVMRVWMIGRARSWLDPAGRPVGRRVVGDGDEESIEFVPGFGVIGWFWARDWVGNFRRDWVGVSGRFGCGAAGWRYLGFPVRPLGI